MGHEALRASNKESDGHKEAIERTMLFWQPRASGRLNVETARQINENIAGYFSLLAAWDADGRTEKAPVQLKHSNVTEITTAEREGSNQPKLKKDTSCTQAHDFLAA
jgi:hypothetical protein